MLSSKFEHSFKVPAGLIVTASYQSEMVQVNPDQLDVITEGDRGTM